MAKAPKEKKLPKLSKKMVDVLLPAEMRILALRVMGLAPIDAYSHDAKTLPAWILENCAKLVEGDLGLLPREKIRPGIIEYLTGIQLSLADGIPMPTWPPGDEYLEEEEEPEPLVTYEEPPMWHTAEESTVEEDDLAEGEEVDLAEGEEVDDDEVEVTPAPAAEPTPEVQKVATKFQVRKTDMFNKAPAAPEPEPTKVEEPPPAPAAPSVDVDALLAQLADVNTKIDGIEKKLDQISNGLLLVINMSGILGDDQTAETLDDIPAPPYDA